MIDAREVAETALNAAVDRWQQAGLTRAFADLVGEVWRINVDRHEPDELGDTARTLGFNCAENLVTRAERRVLADPTETIHWRTPYLKVSKPNGAFRLELGTHHHYLMKAPMADGRRPDWDTLANWENESTTRLNVAQLNSEALGGYRTCYPAQGALFPLMVSENLMPGIAFMLVWAGDMTGQATAGWLTVPALGAVPFAAVRQLWWDDAPQQPRGLRRDEPQGPRFDERATASPSIALKPNAAAAGQA